MDNLKEPKTSNYYNSIPVLYCKHCLSLKIRNILVMGDSDYCDDYSHTDIRECLINEWEELYVERFGHKYLENY